MKKALTISLAIILILSLVACSTNVNNSELIESNISSSQPTSEPTKPTEPEKLDIDYSPYSAIVKAYELDYSVHYNGSESYTYVGTEFTDIEGATTSDARGLVYYDMVDLDSNGVYELIIASTTTGRYNYDSEIYYGESSLEFPNLVKIYTIKNENELSFLGSIPFSDIETAVSRHSGIIYDITENKNYLTVNQLYQMGNGTTTNYSITDGVLSAECTVEISLEGDNKYYLYGNECSEEEYSKVAPNNNERLVIPVTNLNEEYKNNLITRNENTTNYLSNFPINNFTSRSGAYNDGQFYFMENEFQNELWPEEMIFEYYKALTLQDFDTLKKLGIENPEFRHRTHDDGTKPVFAPGFIVSKIEQISTDELKYDEMAQEIYDYAQENTSPQLDIVFLRCTVNEVLDPTVSWLGMQISGGMYETVFTIAIDYTNKEYGWRIVDITDDRFYSNYG